MIGEGVSALVNVMDSWPLVLHSVPVDGHRPTIVGNGKRFVSSGRTVLRLYLLVVCQRASQEVPFTPAHGHGNDQGAGLDGTAQQAALP